MTIERIGLTARWCDAAIFNGIVFLAGHVPEKTEGLSLTEQTQEVLALLEETLADAGSGKERILSVQIFLTDISKIGEMNAVWDKWVAPGHAPARATVEAKLASPGYGIEITAVAAKR
ncbi:RidA family protein [Bosea sp. BH3]|uniref:RidA family protein n=1 Tax=Bosea sp. BH3 TaxID=2871701 RepID=UPI0021CB0794|nr:RidA family protein [Bosea sp. BH3]MCU4182589.1 RidA family protein [Bosea sp. BH3]